MLAEAGAQGMPRRQQWMRWRRRVMQSRIGTETESLLGLPVPMHEEEFEATALGTTFSGCKKGMRLAVLLLGDAVADAAMDVVGGGLVRGLD